MIHVYLDFDGVLNAVNYYAPRDDTGWSGDWSKERINGYQIIWSHELVEELRKLDARPDVTIKWLTTWLSDAPEMLAPKLGIGADWEVLGADTPAHKFEDFAVWWKQECVEKDLTTGPERVIWIDDDFVYETDARKVFDGFDGHWYTVSPKTATGLTRKEWAGILNFINAPELTKE